MNTYFATTYGLGIPSPPPPPTPPPPSPPPLPPPLPPLPTVAGYLTTAMPPATLSAGLIAWHQVSSFGVNVTGRWVRCRTITHSSSLRACALSLLN